jgi:hypothetical protein
MGDSTLFKLVKCKVMHLKFDKGGHGFQWNFPGFIPDRVPYLADNNVSARSRNAPQPPTHPQHLTPQTIHPPLHVTTPLSIRLPRHPPPHTMSSAAISWESHLVTSATQVTTCPSWDVDGTPLLRWIEVISGQCVYGTLGGVSWSFGMSSGKFLTIGYLSILSWLCAQLPQIITNYQNSSIEGLSPLFLTNWFMVWVFLWVDGRVILRTCWDVF